jgi:hypothetical protein
MKTTNQSNVLDFARISLAALSLSLTMPTNVDAANKAMEPNPSKAAENQQHLGVFEGTSFSIKKEGIRHYLVAVNRGDSCRTVCHPSDSNTFKVISNGDPKQPLKITLGDQRFFYLPFAGGSFSRSAH